MDYPLNLPNQFYRGSGNGLNQLNSIQEESSVLISRLSDIKQGDPTYVTRYTKRINDLMIEKLYLNDNNNNNNNNNSNNNVMNSNIIPDYDVLKSNLYPVLNPYSTVAASSLTGQGGTLGYSGLPYFPFFSNCRGSGSYISISKVLENDPGCKIIDYKDTISVSAYPWKNQLIPHADICNQTTDIQDQTFSIGNEYFPTWLGPTNGALFDCNYEEQIEVSQSNIRWYEAGPLVKLFYIGKQNYRYFIFYVVY